MSANINRKSVSNGLGKVFKIGDKVKHSAGWIGFVTEISSPRGFFKCVTLTVKPDNDSDSVVCTTFTLSAA